MTLQPRIIPCLLVQDGGLVKTRKFKDPTYVGDPINAVRIYNEKEADELIVLDISASSGDKDPDLHLIKRLAAESRMPICYGGGIASVETAEKIISLGIEKISISTNAIKDMSLVTKISNSIGRQSTVVVADILSKRTIFGSKRVLVSKNGTLEHKISPKDFAMSAVAAGAGEIVLNSVNNDGEMQGYDVEQAAEFRKTVDVPLTILGGAGSIRDIEHLFQSCGLVGAAAGSLFVFKGKYRAVLINYPDHKTRDHLAQVVHTT